MGNKVNPIGMRLQVNRTWDSRWYADTKDYGDLLLEDLAIRDFIKKECAQAGIARVIIERPHKKCRVTIHTARPGVIIGKKGADIEGLRQKIAKITKSDLHLNIVEVRKPELDAALVGESIAQQLERRVSFRRAMKRAVQNAMRMGALGTLLVVWVVQKSRVPNGTVKAACRSTLCVPTSITRMLKRRPLTASSGSKPGSSKARSWNMTRLRVTARHKKCKTAQHHAVPAVVAKGE